MSRRQVHRGLKGVVRDKESKKGIEDAMIKVEDHGHDIRTGKAAKTGPPPTSRSLLASAPAIPQPPTETTGAC